MNRIGVAFAWLAVGAFAIACGGGRSGEAVPAEGSRAAGPAGADGGATARADGSPSTSAGAPVDQGDAQWAKDYLERTFAALDSVHPRERLQTDLEAARAVALLERACEGGSGPACAYLAQLRDTGTLTRDPETSMALRKRACELGDRDACSAALHVDGALLARAPADHEAVGRRYLSLLERDCKTEHMACFQLGLVFRKGIEGVAVDPARASEIFAAVCQRSGALGCAERGAMIERGEGGSPDPERAARLYDDYCRRVPPVRAACAALGRMHDDGRGVNKSPASSCEFHGRACELSPMGKAGSEVASCVRAAGCHEKGIGMKKNRARAVELYRAACGAANGAACDALKRLKEPLEAPRAEEGG